MWNLRNKTEKLLLCLQFLKNTRPRDSNQDVGHRTHLPRMSTSKIRLHVKQFSRKTNWTLAERLLYNQGLKKDTHGVG